MFWNIVVGLVLTGLCVLAFRSVRKRKDQGCDGCCAGCPHAAGCTLEKKDKTEQGQ